MIVVKHFSVPNCSLFLRRQRDEQRLNVPVLLHKKSQLECRLRSVHHRHVHIHQEQDPPRHPSTQ